jgi:hypothetical protein
MCGKAAMASIWGKKAAPLYNAANENQEIWPAQLRAEVDFWGLNSALIKKRVTRRGDEKSRTGN